MDVRAGVRRWAGTVLVAVLIAAGCAAAGVWQWNRHLARAAVVAVVEANVDAPPTRLDDVLPAGGLVGDDAAALAPDLAWRPVRVTGHYLPDATVLLRNRPVGGQPGFHVLEPLVVDDGALAGAVVVVDRGWVPTGPDGSDAGAVPLPPPGPVEVIGRLRPDEPSSSRAAPPDQVQAISVDQVRASSGAEGWPEATVGAYVMVLTEDGRRPPDLGALPRPSTSLGSHLSYAFQWWVFAAGALVGCVVLVVREHRQDAADLADAALGGGGPGAAGRGGRDPGSAERGGTDADDRPALLGRAGPRRPTRGRRRATAEQEEDALLDAQSPTV